jgi:hypothetical protein
LVGTSHTNIIFERDFIGAAIAEVSDELEKVDIPVGNRSRCGRLKEEGTNVEGLEDRGGHRDDSVKVVDDMKRVLEIIQQRWFETSYAQQGLQGPANG